MIAEILQALPADRPVLIAGPTASGKSALALHIAETQGGVIVNADASQVYDCWRVITARPSAQEEARAPHALYGTVAWDQDWSTGHWLRAVQKIMTGDARPIIVGGTGLYFMALTEGLSEIPPVPHAVRAEADALPLPRMLADLDAETTARIDTANRARVQRAWEVWRATGRTISAWQADTARPFLRLKDAAPMVVDAPKEWLTPRIERRFDAMLESGALDEVAAMAAQYDPARPAFRAIGVPELYAHLNGETSLGAAREAVTIATRQYAKRQRTWLRRRCAKWDWLPAAALAAL